MDAAPTALRGAPRCGEKSAPRTDVRNASSGKYYARFRVHGKLVWGSLETASFTVAKTKLPDVVKAEKQLVAASDGQITLAQAVKIYLDRDERNPGLKEKTRQYHAAAADIVGRFFRVATRLRSGIAGPHNPRRSSETPLGASRRDVRSPCEHQFSNIDTGLGDDESG